MTIGDGPGGPGEEPGTQDQPGGGSGPQDWSGGSAAPGGYGQPGGGSGPQDWSGGSAAPGGYGQPGGGSGPQDWSGGSAAPGGYGQPARYPAPLSYGGYYPQLPNNYLVWAILTTIFCCLPFGIVAIVFAAQVNTKFIAGDFHGAEDASRKARLFSIVSAAITGGFLVIYVIVAIIGAILASQAHSTG